MSFIVYLLLLSLVVYRVSRFIVLDTLIDGWRHWFMEVFLMKRRRHLVARKLYELMGCPYCVTIWISAGAVLVSLIYMDVPLPVFTWLAASGGALVVWALVDSEEGKKGSG